MADVAQLGIAVDTSQLKAGSAELRNFESVAKRTNETVEQVQKRFGEASKRFSEAATQTKAMTAATAPANEQLTRLAVSSDRTNVTLTRLFGFTIGQVAARAAGDLARYVRDLSKTLSDTADTADRVGLSYQKMQGLGTAAAYKGVSSNDFNSGMLKFNEQLDLAKSGLGSLGTLLRVNGKTVGDTATTFGVVADMVKNAGSEAQKFSILQQAGLPATREFVKLMEQGSTSINRQADAARKLTDQQMADAKRVDEAWNRAWTDFERWGKQAVVNVGDGIKNMPTPFAHQGTWLGAKLQGMGFDRPEDPNSSRNQGLDMLRRGQGSSIGNANSVYGGIGAFGPNAPEKKNGTVDPDRLKQTIGLEQQRIGILGQTASVSQQVRAVELQIQTARINGISITGAEADNLKRLAKEQALGITQIKASADSYGVELATIGMTTGAAATYTAVQNKLNEAKRNGVTLSQDNIAQIQREADAMGRAAQTVEDTRFQYDTFKSSFVEFGQNLRSGQGAWTSFSNAATSALGKISDKLMSMAADNLWKAAFGGATGGMGNFFSSIFGGDVSGGSSSNPLPGLSASDYGPGFATGGYTGAGAKYQPAGIVHAGEFVFNQSAVTRLGIGNLERLHRGYADGGFVKPSSFANENSIGKGGPVVNIINQTSGQVEHGGVTQKPDGSFDVVIRNMVTGVMKEDAGKNGPISQAFAARAQGFGGR